MPIVRQYQPVQAIGELARMGGRQQQAVRQQAYDERRASEERGHRYQLDILGRQREHSLDLLGRYQVFDDYMQTQRAQQQIDLSELGFTHDMARGQKEFEYTGQLQQQGYQAQDYLTDKQFYQNLENLYQQQDHQVYMTGLNNQLAMKRDEQQLYQRFAREQALQDQRFQQQITSNNQLFSTELELAQQQDLRDWQEYQSRRQAVINNSGLSEDELSRALLYLDIGYKEAQKTPSAILQRMRLLNAGLETGVFTPEMWQQGMMQQAGIPQGMTPQQEIAYHQALFDYGKSVYEAAHPYENYLNSPQGRIAAKRFELAKQQNARAEQQSSRAAERHGWAGQQFDWKQQEAKELGYTTQERQQTLQQPITIVNPATGERRVSYDKGQTWQPIQ